MIQQNITDNDTKFTQNVNDTPKPLSVTSQYTEYLLTGTQTVFEMSVKCVGGLCHRD